MSNYTIRYTDASKAALLVNSDQTNGPASPTSMAMYVNPITGLTSTSATTPLVFAGRGITDYGELVQNNLLYLLENFSNPVRPAATTRGMLWHKSTDTVDPNHPTDPSYSGLFLWNGIGWKYVLTSQDGESVDVRGLRLTNIVTTTDDDAISRGYADARYVSVAQSQVIGGSKTFSDPVTFNGDITLGSQAQLTITSTPVQGTDAVNKDYVDNIAGSDQGLQNEIQARIDEDAAIRVDITTLTTNVNTRLPKTGGLVTGTIALSGAAGLQLAPGAGTASFGSRVLQDVGLPQQPTDAANRQFVESLIATVQNKDGVVNGGSLSSEGVLSLTRTQSLPPVIITGEFALKAHQHSTSTISHDLTLPYSQSTLILSEMGVTGYPVIPLYNAITTLDQRLTDLARPVKRKVTPATGNTTYALGSDMSYSVADNRLMVFVNGVKKYASERGSSKIVFSAPSIGARTLIGLNGTYVFNVSVDGGPSTQLSIVATPVTNYYQLAVLISQAISSQGLAVSVDIDQSYNQFILLFKSNSSGAGSGVTVSYAAGELFRAITASSAPTNVTITQTLDYKEIGTPGEASSTIQFASVQTGLIEVLVIPG